MWASVGSLHSGYSFAFSQYMPKGALCISFATERATCRRQAQSPHFPDTCSPGQSGSAVSFM